MSFLREFIEANKVYFTTVPPNKVCAYAKTKGLLAKSDKIDGKLIADYVTAFSLPVEQNYNPAS